MKEFNDDVKKNETSKVINQRLFFSFVVIVMVKKGDLGTTAKFIILKTGQLQTFVQVAIDDLLTFLLLSNSVYVLIHSGYT